MHENIYIAVRHGHRQLAADLMEEREKMGMTSFNTLHSNVSPLMFVIVLCIDKLCIQYIVDAYLVIIILVIVIDVDY